MTHQFLIVCSSIPRRLIISGINFFESRLSAIEFSWQNQITAFSEKIPLKAYLPYLQVCIITACNWQYTPIMVIPTSLHLTEVLWSSSNKWLFAWHLLLSDSELAGIGRLRGSSQRGLFCKRWRICRGTQVWRGEAAQRGEVAGLERLFPTQEIHSTSNMQTVFY